MATHLVGKVDEFGDRDRKVVQIGDAVIGVFRLGEDFHAWYSECPHQGGPICQGRLFNRVIEPIDADGSVHGRTYDETLVNIVCPWHGYEYDLRTGRHPGNPSIRLKPAEVRVADGEVFLDV